MRGGSTPRRVHGSGASDVWAVGGDPLGAGPVPALLRWDGGGWTSVAPPAEAAGKTLYKVWGAAADDVWAVGEAGTIEHWDGSTWSGTAPLSTAKLNDIWASGSGEVWAVKESPVRVMRNQ